MSEKSRALNDLAKITAISFMKSFQDKLGEMEKSLQEDGKQYITEGRALNDVKQLRAVDFTQVLMNTSGDPIANDILTDVLNHFEEALMRDFKPLKRIKTRFKNLKFAFNKAVSKNSQAWTKIQMKIMESAQGSVNTIDTDTIYYSQNQNQLPYEKRNQIEID